MEPKTVKLAALIAGPIVLVLLLKPGLAASLAPVIALVVIFTFVAWMGHRLGWYGHSARRTDGLIDVFGRTQRRPLFLDAGDGLFKARQGVRIYRRGHGGRTEQYQVWNLFKRSQLNERRLLEALSESARLVRKQRGLDVTDTAGQPLDPPIEDAGVLVEVVDDEGGQTRIYATGLEGELAPADYIAATDAGFGRYRGAWCEPPHAAVVIDDKPNENPLIWKQQRPASGSMPLFVPRLAAYRVPVQPNPDPLAPASTEKGSARWGNPFADPA